MSAATYTKTGTKATAAAKLDKAVFGENITSYELLKSAYVAYQANSRENLAIAKTRGQVSGGGKKPWRQKGTGRARAGSIRSPIWRGGGITFGPSGEETYTHKLNKKAKHKALRQALTLKSTAGELKVIETFECKDGAVKPTLKLLDKIQATGKVLIVVSDKDDLVDRATRNIPHVKAVQANMLNVYDLLNADTIVMSQKALEHVNEWLSPSSETAAKTGGAK